MALDPNIFFQGAALRNQRQQQDLSALINLGNTFERIGDKKEKGLDLEKLAQRAVYKTEMGVGVSPEEQAAFKAYQKFESAKQGVDPNTGELYPKFRSFELGGTGPKGFDISILPESVRVPKMMENASYAPAPTAPLSVNDLQSTGDPEMDAKRQEAFYRNSGLQANGGLDPAVMEAGLSGSDALPQVEYLPPIPTDEQAGLNLNAFRPVTADNNLRLPTPQNPIQERANYEAQLDIAKGAAKAAQDVSAAGQKKTAEAQAEKEANRPKAEMAYKNVLAKSKNIDNTIDKAIGMVNQQTAGLGSQIKDVKIPFTGINVGAGSKSKDLESLLSTIGADSAFSELQAMRDASPTGGALGSITERELSLLQNAVAALDQSQSPQQLRENLANYKKTRQEALNRVRDAYEQQYGGGTSAPSNAVSYEEYFR